METGTSKFFKFMNHCTEKRTNLSIVKVESVIRIIQSICKITLITHIKVKFLKYST